MEGTILHVCQTLRVYCVPYLFFLTQSIVSPMNPKLNGEAMSSTSPSHYVLPIRAFKGQLCPCICPRFFSFCLTHFRLSNLCHFSMVPFVASLNFLRYITGHNIGIWECFYLGLYQYYAKSSDLDLIVSRQICLLRPFSWTHVS